MSNIVLQSQDLIATSKTIEKCADELATSIQKLEMIMSSLESVWSGDGSNEYLERYAELKQKFPAFEAAVRSYGTFLKNVVETYRKELENASGNR